MPSWMIDEPGEVEAREAEQKQIAQQAIVEAEADRYRAECRMWAKEIYIFHEIYNLSLSGNPCFNHMLIALIRKADSTNKARLHVGFPVAVKMVMEWESSDPWDFYLSYDIRALLHGGEHAHYDARLNRERPLIAQAEEAISEAEEVIEKYAAEDEEDFEVEDLDDEEAADPYVDDEDEDPDEKAYYEDKDNG